VLEAIKPDLASEITAHLSIPTIGIGAGPGVDGQIMVINDIIGLDEEFEAKFVRKYFNLAAKLREVGEGFISDVRSGGYPSEDETY
jgi:3-methyl-2-oxobutanoate hydroxymethyltransferase